MKQPKSVAILTLLLVVIALWLVGCGGGGSRAVTTPAERKSPASRTSPHPAEVRLANGGALLGDLDGDGNATVGDAIKILRIVVGLDSDDPCADANENGGTDVGDAIKVLRCVVGLDPWPIGECGGGVSTVVGYVGAGVGAAQDGGPPPLQLLTDPPVEPVGMALVKLQSGSETVERRTLDNGCFAAQVPAGPLTVTAYPPEDKRDQYSESASVNVTAVEGQVTRVDGSTAGAPPTVRPADFFPLNLKDKRCFEGEGWEEDGGYWGWNPDDWQGIIIGTTSIAGQTAYVMVDPHGQPPGVIAMQGGSAQVIASYGMILRPLADGSIMFYGRCSVVKNDSTYEVIGCMFDAPLTWPVMTLGKQYTSSTTVHQETLSVSLAPGVSLSDLYDPSGWTSDLEPCPQSITWTLSLAGLDIPMHTDAGDFTDTIAFSFVEEATTGGDIIDDVEHMMFARHVGVVAARGFETRRLVGQPSGSGDLIQWYWQKLVYARVSGVEYGTPP